VEIRGKSGLAKHFGVSRTTADAWCRRGCPHEEVAGKFIFDSEVVEAWRRKRDRTRGPVRKVRTIAEIEDEARMERDDRTPGLAIAETFAAAILFMAASRGKGWDFRTDPEAMELVQQIADTIDGK